MTARSGRASRAPGRPALIAAVPVLIAGLGLIWAGLHPGSPQAAPLPAATFGQAAPASAPGTAPALAPRRLSIPSLGIEAPIDDSGLTASGDLVIPGDPATVGHWTGGAALSAARGTTVLAGHVDVSGDLGALHPLARIGPGALAYTSDASGRVTAWSVTALEVRRKDDLPVLPSSGPRRLVIVTCGGPVLREDGRWTYRDNVLATAVPI